MPRSDRPQRQTMAERARAWAQYATSTACQQIVQRIHRFRTARCGFLRPDVEQHANAGQYPSYGNGGSPQPKQRTAHCPNRFVDLLERQIPVGRLCPKAGDKTHSYHVGGSYPESNKANSPGFPCVPVSVWVLNAIRSVPRLPARGVWQPPRLEIPWRIQPPSCSRNTCR